MKDDHEDDPRVYRCGYCGALYDSHTLPRRWSPWQAERIPFCRTCNTTQIEEVE